jgi:hypothetical protein
MTPLAVPKTLTTDSLPPKEGKAFVFPSLTSILEDFATFYELLAPAALADDLHLARLNILEGGHLRPVEPRFCIQNPEDARLLPRTEIGRDIVDVFKRFFAAMAASEDHEMRRICFVETAESREADTSLEKITAHLTNTIKSLDADHGQELQREIANVIGSKLSEICLIVGGSGSGKSTFLVRFFEDVLADELRDDCVIVTVDVSQFPGGDESIQRWLAETLRDAYEPALFRDEEPAYDDFMGMFFSTYKRWSNAIYRDLYRTDKPAFKIKFGEFVEERREERPHDYVVGLLHHTVHGRKRLPCIVFDNIDRFPPNIQDQIIQYASALKTTCPCFILLTAADRAIWRLSKAANIQSYFSRTFFLPTPATKEILSRRVGYIRAKLEGDERISGEYFSSRGLKISIKNLGAFATVIEETLINHASISDFLGRLSNFDIAKMLQLAERVISSPTLNVDDLVTSFFTPKGMAPFDQKRVMKALIVGDYDRHSTLSNEYLINVFGTDGSYPYSPLLCCSILLILLNLQISPTTDVDSFHMAVATILNFFEPCGVARDETRKCLKQLFESRLISPLDPTDDVMLDGTKVAITPRGHAHLDLASVDEVYLSQMARVTGVRYSQTREVISQALLNSEGQGSPGRSAFSKYVLSDDAAKLRVPNVEGYSLLTKFRNEFAANWSSSGTAERAQSANSSSTQTSSSRSRSGYGAATESPSRRR